MATNVAASANGATASASSTFSGGHLPSAANNGDRTGGSPPYASGGAWASVAHDISGAWLQIDFSGSFAISEIDVFGLQDNYTSPTTPTLSMTSVLYGLQNFDIQYWTGSAWATVPGGAITGNNHVWVQVTFSPVTTANIRVLGSTIQSGSSYTICAELEAWTAPSAPGSPSSPSPADTATGVSLTPTLTWTSSGATSYDVYFGTAASPPLVSSGQASASYMPAALSGVTTYFWKIVAINGGGSTTGSIWSFTTTSGSAQTAIDPTTLVEAELSGVGNGWSNLTADVLRPYGVETRHGMQGSGPADLVAPSGTARFALNNSAQNSASLLGYYSPYHANKLTGWGLGISCRVRMQDPNTGSYYTRFVGRIDSINPIPGKNRERAVTVTATDWMDEAARWAIPPTIGPQVSKRGEEILTSIVALMPRQPTATSFDVGTEAYTYALDTSPSNEQPALAEFVKLAESEFGPIYLKADGTLRFENRHTRILNTTSVWTITENELQDLLLPSTRDEVINVVRVTGHDKIVDPDPTVLVYNQANVLEIGAGQSTFFGGPFRNPVTGDSIGATDVQPQVSGTDYQANTRDDGTGTDISSDLTWVANIGPSGATFEVVNNNASTAYLITNNLYGRGVYDLGTIQFEARDSASVSTLGELTTIFDMPYQDDGAVVTGAATYILNRYSNAFAQARRIRVVATSATLLAQLLTRDISDRVTISESVTGLSSDYVINGETLRVLPSGHLVAEYVLAPTADQYAGLYFILDTSVLDGANVLAAF